MTPPPGQQRPYPSPTKTGTISFSYPSTGLEGETAYKLWGDLSSTSKTPLICMHGGPGATSVYLQPISLIHVDHDIPVILYDQIGCGASTRFPETKGDVKFWTPQLFMTELENLIEFLGIKEFDLLGQSWGGMCGAQWAIERQPKGLRKLVVSNSPTDMRTWVDTANRLRRKLPEEVQETLTRCEKEGKTDSEEYVKAVHVFYDEYVCRVKPWPKEMVETVQALEGDPTVYETMNGPSEFHVIGSLKDWHITDELVKITEKTCPGGLLVINALHDEAQDETCEAYFTKPLCRTKWLRYPLSSHMTMLEETESYVRDLSAFLLSQ